MSLIGKVNAIPIFDVAEKLGICIKKMFAMCFNGHDKNSPSLHFNYRKNLWYCFGCGVGGANLQLVMRYFNCNFQIALQWFKTQYPHIQFESNTLTDLPNFDFARVAYHEQEEEFQANPSIYKWILDHTHLSTTARTYLNKRGYRGDVIEKLQIRYIDNTTAFYTKLRQVWSVPDLKKAGLLRENESKKLLFLWWKPVILFPFFSKEGVINYLQGRFIDDTAVPRYVNLRGIEKPIYNLHSLVSMKKGEQIFFMEGVTDTIAAIQDGLNAFGILGACSFKDDYVKDFKHFKIRVVPDNDKAGGQFSNKISEAFGKVTKKVRVLEIGPHKDYAEYSKAKYDSIIS